jgi:hypothetical protein
VVENTTFGSGFHSAVHSILVGGLPVQHRLVQPSSHQVDADPSDLVGDQSPDLLVGRRCRDVAVRPDDVAVE